MYTLGLSGGADPVYASLLGSRPDFLHDSAAVLLRDGVVVAGVEEERLNRIKHTNKFWTGAVEFCLKEAGIGLGQVDDIAIYMTEDNLSDVIKRLNLVRSDVQGMNDVRWLTRALLEQAFGVAVADERLRFVHHHLCHAASSYYISGFDDSLVLTIDGAGDDTSTMVLDAAGKRFTTLLQKPTELSLGIFYLEIIRFLGYYQFDEYKVMGLAPYGDAKRYESLFKRFYTLLPNGDYDLHLGSVGTKDRLMELYDVVTPRRRGEAFGQVHMDIAAALQAALEDIVMHVLAHFRASSGRERLVMSGGVAQNSSMNGKILRSGLFDDVFVPSFSGDSGGALGAAMYVAHAKQPALPQRGLNHAYWGPAIPGGQEQERLLRRWEAFLEIEPMSNTCSRVAQLIDEGAVFGWVQGRSEFGPRALGNRSIIADPRVASHKETINAMIKKRESYRPFAPSIQEEYVREFFEVPGQRDEFPFMSFVLPVTPDKRHSLPAITHVDGTARLQTVSKATNPRYWELLEAFRQRTGIPILLNTSFNNNAEPIVDSIDDAVVCYLTSGLDYLAVGDYLVWKKPWNDEALKSLLPSLPVAACLNRERHYVDNHASEVSHGLYWNYNVERKYPLSPEWYELLDRADGRRSMAELMECIGLAGSRRAAVLEQLPELWSDRLVVLRPPPRQ